MATLATDSAAELHKLIGDDATATFENDPKFAGPAARFDAAGTASSENIAVQRDEDDVVDSDEELDDEEDDDDELDEDDDDEDEEEDGEDEVEDDEALDEEDDADAPAEHADRAVNAALRM